MAKGQGRKDPAKEAFEAGFQLVRGHPLLGTLISRARIERSEKNGAPSDCWAVVVEDGNILVHPTRRGEPAEWARVLAHCVLHLGFGHFQRRAPMEAWAAASCIVVERFLGTLKFGKAPLEMLAPDDLPSRSEEALFREFADFGIPEELKHLHPGSRHAPDLWFRTPGSFRYAQEEGGWQKLFSQALTGAVSEVIHAAAGMKRDERTDTPGHEARAWFLNNYPLLGSLAVAFKIIEDPAVLARLSVQTAAVNPRLRELYINSRGLKPDEIRFVMAHELLHVGLRHDERRQGRDPYLWNVACDYVINHWLVEMGIGRMPAVGGLLDPELKGLSAEAIYDRIVQDMRRFRKLATLRGVGLVDVLDEGPRGFWKSTGGMTLDEFYRRCLSQGLEYHRDQGRGLLPASLVEEIRALSQPPVPWDVQLAQLLDRWFPPLEKRRSFARPSRRQSSTPDLPRPSWVRPLDAMAARTFAVVLDTSASMTRSQLAKALGAISSYSMARDVPAVRVVFCDAAPYDQGYMPVEHLALNAVQVKGRGGTVLQPAIDLLRKSADDFAKDGPILVITDGECDELEISGEHAFILPEGASLPFVPRGPVFRVE